MAKPEPAKNEDLRDAAAARVINLVVSSALLATVIGFCVWQIWLQTAELLRTHARLDSEQLWKLLGPVSVLFAIVAIGLKIREGWRRPR